MEGQLHSPELNTTKCILSVSEIGKCLIIFWSLEFENSVRDQFYMYLNIKNT